MRGAFAWAKVHSSIAAPKPFLPPMNFIKSVFFNPLICMAMGMALLSGCSTSTKGLKSPPEPYSRVRGPEFQQAMGSLLGPPFAGGNRITTYENGDEIFPAMLGGIRSAKRTITFETFVFEKGTVPRQFADALAERARAGVKVHVVIDAVGGSKSRRYHDMMRSAGVELVLFRPIWQHPVHFNHRSHRKLLVIDGTVGYMGGVGIADEWRGNAQSPEHWHETHYKVEGPAVADMQAAFMDNWLKSGQELLHGPDYFPPLKSAGSALASVFYASPEHGSRNVEIMFNLAISSARKSLLIENAYFVPDDGTVDNLVAAAKRGVRVQIIVPGEHMDQPAVKRASRRRWGKLMEAGIEIYEYKPTMTHLKLLIADDLFVSVGSSNFDYRSPKRPIYLIR